MVFVLEVLCTGDMELVSFQDYFWELVCCPCCCCCWWQWCILNSRSLFRSSNEIYPNCGISFALTWNLLFDLSLFSSTRHPNIFPPEPWSPGKDHYASWETWQGSLAKSLVAKIRRKRGWLGVCCFGMFGLTSRDCGDCGKVEFKRFQKERLRFRSERLPTCLQLAKDPLSGVS